MDYGGTVHGTMVITVTVSVPTLHEQFPHVQPESRKTSQLLPSIGGVISVSIAGADVRRWLRAQLDSDTRPKCLSNAAPDHTRITPKRHPK